MFIKIIELVSHYYYSGGMLFWQSRVHINGLLQNYGLLARNFGPPKIVSLAGVTENAG